MGTIIKTDGIISNPKYLYNGYVINLDTTKYHSNHLIYITFDSTMPNELYTVKAYGGKLLYYDDAEVENYTESTVGNVTVYTYQRPSSPGIYVRYKASATTSRIDIISDNTDKMMFHFNNRLPSGSYTKGYFNINYDQLRFHNLTTVKQFLYAAFDNIEIDIDKLNIGSSITGVTLSQNNLVKGNIVNFAKCIASFPNNGFLGLGYTNISGSFEEFAAAAAPYQNTAKRITVNINGSKVIYNNAIVSKDYYVDFDGNGGYTITEYS